MGSVSISKDPGIRWKLIVRAKSKNENLKWSSGTPPVRVQHFAWHFHSFYQSQKKLTRSFLRFIGYEGAPLRNNK